MKTFLALGALAALFQSAFSQMSFTIRPASLQDGKVLTATEQMGQPLTFSPKDGDGGPGQVWTLVEGWNDEFLIRNEFGHYINCSFREPNSPCNAGQTEQVYVVRNLEDGISEFRLFPTPWFLRADGETLKLAREDQSPNEQFIVEPAWN